MPAGKPAGVRCVHLDEALRCGLWQRPERPATCAAFTADASVCGTNRDQALALIARMEIDTDSP